jgi:hypothetical protein
VKVVGVGANVVGSPAVPPGPDVGIAAALVMSGTGIGFSVERQSIVNLPNIPQDLVTTIFDDAEKLKQVLLETIASSHPDFPSQITDEEYIKNGEQCWVDTRKKIRVMILNDF